jgi:hypothetical protein
VHFEVALRARRGGRLRGLGDFRGLHRVGSAA